MLISTHTHRKMFTEGRRKNCFMDSKGQSYLQTPAELSLGDHGPVPGHHPTPLTYKAFAKSFGAPLAPHFPLLLL